MKRLQVDLAALIFHLLTHLKKRDGVAVLIRSCFFAFIGCFNYSTLQLFPCNPIFFRMLGVVVALCFPDALHLRLILKRVFNCCQSSSRTCHKLLKVARLLAVSIVSIIKNFLYSFLQLYMWYTNQLIYFLKLLKSENKLLFLLLSCVLFWCSRQLPYKL